MRPWVLLLFPSASFAATLHVGPTQAFESIEDALEAASPGDTIEVDPGTYEDALLVTKSVRIVGSGSATTTITGEDEEWIGPLVVITGGVDVEIEGLSLTDGDCGIELAAATLVLDDVVISEMGCAEDGGALRAMDGAVVTATDVWMIDNHSDQDGGALALEASFLWWSTGSLDGNEADGSGGALRAIDGSYVELVGVDFTDNSAGGSAAALEAVDSELTTSSCTFDAHTSFADAPTVRVGGTSTWLGTADSFTNNHGLAAASAGGAVAVHDATTAELVQCEFRFNAADRGGALYFGSTGMLSLDQCTFADNSADAAGGAVDFEPSAQSGALVVTSTSFLANDATGVTGSGGAVYLGDGTTSLLDSTFTDNEAARGGGLYANGTEALEVARSTLCKNEAADGSGGGAYLVGVGATGPFSWTNNAIVENTATESGGGLYVSGSLSSPEVVNNTWLGNGTDAVYFYATDFEFVNNLVGSTSPGAALAADAGVGARTYTITYGDFDANAAALGGGLASTSLDATNLAVAPALVAWSDDGDCSNDDLRLQLGSPLIDAGDPTRLDPDGSRSDIGAFGGPGVDDGLFEDADNDEYTAMYDCDDLAAEVHPGAVEICGNDIDEDCDGIDAPCDTDAPVDTDDTTFDDSAIDSDDDSPLDSAVELDSGDAIVPEGCSCEGRGMGGTWSLMLLPLAASSRLSRRSRGRARRS